MWQQPTCWIICLCLQPGPWITFFLEELPFRQVPAVGGTQSSHSRELFAVFCIELKKGAHVDFTTESNIQLPDGFNAQTLCLKQMKSDASFMSALLYPIGFLRQELSFHKQRTPNCKITGVCRALQTCLLALIFEG